MPYEETLTSYSMYSPQKDYRSTFSHFQGAGLDLFSSICSQNPNGFLQLNDVMPAVSGGFRRRWGTGVPTQLTGFTGPVSRMFSCQVADETDGTTEYPAYFAMLGTDNSVLREIYGENAHSQDSQQMTGFSGNGELFATLSRAYVYAFNGVDTPQKKSFSENGPQTHIGITNPTTSQVTITSTPGTGQGYSNNPSVTFNPNGSGGSGASAHAVVKKGTIVGFIMDSSGAAYGYDSSGGDLTGSNAGGLVVISDATGTGATGSIHTNSRGSILGVSTTGNIILNSGRLYGVAFKSSVTGHVTDVTFAAQNANYIAGYQTINPNATEGYVAFDPSSGEGWYNQGCSVIVVDISIVGPLDGQVDTILLVATSDGGDLEHLYEVAQIPLSSFTNTNGTYTYEYLDTLPDTYNDTYLTGNTLLENNLWADVDASGNLIGILQNDCPDPSSMYPVIHQGRMFASNGQTVFFSKDLTEVTTSTGLITCKWEEAWPDNNRLDITFDNEVITGLLTDTTFLYIGTTQNIYRLSGTDADSFSIQCIFRNVGVQNQDSWSVVFKENLPAGYLWITPDNKVMFSDFNNYQDVGVPIYPLLDGLSDFRIQSWTRGPYSFAVVRSGGNSTFLYNLKTGTWYQWTAQIGNGPVLTYTESSGLSYLYFVDNQVSTPYLGRFDPEQNEDAFQFGRAAQPITWSIRTGWQDMSDPTALKVLNEMECWSGEPSLQTALYCKNNAQEADPTPVVRNATSATLSCLTGMFKAYYAGQRTAGRLFSFQIGCNNPGTDPNVLEQFITEHYPCGRM